MSTLSPAFLRRVTVAVGGLVLVVAIFVAREAFARATCAMSIPYAPNSPAVMTCSRPLQIMGYDQSSYAVESMKDDVGVIVPIRPWAGRTFDFSYRLDALPFIHSISVPTSSPPPTVFFTDGASPGTVLAAKEGYSPAIAPVFNAPGSTRVRFDGQRFFYYLKRDENSGGLPDVWKYDPATRASAVEVMPLIGKTITDFFPTNDENVRALEETLGSGRKTLLYMNNMVEGHTLQWMEIAHDTVFDSTIFAPDGTTLSVIDRTRNRLDVYDTMGYLAPAHSPSPAGQILGHGFIGENGDIPAFWTDKGLWSLGVGSWSFAPMPGLSKAGACGGKTFFLTKEGLRDDSGPLAQAPTGQSFEDLAITSDCTLFIMSKETGNGSEKIQAVTRGALREIYASTGPISFVGHD
jgi:hypothetical protein